MAKNCEHLIIFQQLYRSKCGEGGIGGVDTCREVVKLVAEIQSLSGDTKMNRVVSPLQLTPDQELEQPAHRFQTIKPPQCKKMKNEK